MLRAAISSHYNIERPGPVYTSLAGFYDVAAYYSIENTDLSVKIIIL